MKFMLQLVRLPGFPQGRARWFTHLKVRVLGRPFNLGRDSETDFLASKDSEEASNNEVSALSLAMSSPRSDAHLRHPWLVWCGRTVPQNSSMCIICYFVVFFMRVCDQGGTMLVSNFSY